MNNEYYKTGGPVFIMIGGEGAASASWMHAGAWINYAKTHNALIFMLEHRFYGKSHPTPDLSVDSLKYLNSEQAIADLAYFIMLKMFELNIMTKWIAFGGSYAGALAVWLREKHPNLVIGAVSSSGPILAKADFIEYFQVVENSLRTRSDYCASEIKNALYQLKLLVNLTQGRSLLSKYFNFCTPLEESDLNTNDITCLFEAISNGIAGIVQYDRKFSASGKLSINDVCDIMLNSDTGLQLKRLSQITQKNLMHENLDCFDIRYDDQLNSLRQISWESSDAEGG